MFLLSVCLPIFLSLFDFYEIVDLSPFSFCVDFVYFFLYIYFFISRLVALPSAWQTLALP